MSNFGRPMNLDRVANTASVERLPFKAQKTSTLSCGEKLMHKLLKLIFTCKHFKPLNIKKMN